MTIVKTVSAFPVPVMFGTLGSAAQEMNTHLCVDTKVEVEHQYELRSGVGVLQTTGGLESRYESFKLLQKALTEAVQQTLPKFGVLDTPVTVEDFWANYNPGNPHAFHMPHSHSVDGYMFTGVYFPMSLGDNDVDTLPTIHADSQPLPGALVLLDPIENIKSAVSRTNTRRYPFFGIPLSVVPQQSAFVVFPSYLSHMVTPTNTAEERLTIAFNVRV